MLRREDRYAFGQSVYLDYKSPADCLSVSSIEFHTFAPVGI